MKLRYALIAGNRVVNVVMLTAEEAAAAITGYDAVIQTEAAGPGWSWSEGGGFVAPDPSIYSPRIRWWSKVNFWLLFTGAERRAIHAARNTDAVLNDYMYIFELRPEIDRDDSGIVVFLNHLVTQGLITLARKREILDLES